ncbi:MAG TPA: C25 family cysteine peptidase, partial [Thermoanaerobaculaceae bacterium]|nr:C25 family cysteine peptidase [Thermoanaerobaculaceae bacterium]
VLAVGVGGVQHPVGAVPNRPTSWHLASNGADLVIVAHRSLLSALEPLRALRESQGLKVAVVDVESVFDEFAFGVKGPQAIRDLLAHAKATWTRPPRYLLLAGDASYDPRNYLYGYADLVPTKLVDIVYMETASDDWFADFDSDGIADLAVGRIPVQSAAEAATVVGKLVTYDGGPQFGRVLLLADANDEDNDFEGLSAQVKAVLPGKVYVSEVLRGQVGDAAAKSELASQLIHGQTLVNYLGHGSIAMWHGNLLTAEEARTLSNYYYPFVVSMTCLNGFFHDPHQESLGEGLLEGPGGAVAVWASSGLTESKAQVTIDEALIRLLFSGTTTLGDATKAAKAATSDMDVRRSWILFGDPTTKLR